MLYLDYTKEIIGLQDIIINKVETEANLMKIHIQMRIKEHKCPNCGSQTTYVHDYRVRSIKDLSSFGSNVILLYKQRRYVCNHCGKRFAENNSFVSKYYRVTHRLLCEVFKRLESECSFTCVSKQLNLSVPTVIRYFDMLSYSPPKTLPTVFAIDEFKGNAGGEKYQAIITDAQNGVVLDILPDRKTHHLCQYIKHWERSERQNVQFFVSDMWKPYAEFASIYFKNATQIVDKYHYIRQCIWAFERVRKKVQNKYGQENRLLFKHSKSLLTMRKTKLKTEQLERVEHLLYLSDDIRNAYYLKEAFYEVVDCKNKDDAKKKMSDWILLAQASGLPDYETCAKALINWSKSILNTFDNPYTNGFTEGCNNKIKVLKRNAYGYRNFDRFRKRILHMFNYKHIKNAVA